MGLHKSSVTHYQRAPVAHPQQLPRHIYFGVRLPLAVESGGWPEAGRRWASPREAPAPFPTHGKTETAG